MNAREMRTKSDDELKGELRDLHREAFNLRMQKGMGQLSRAESGEGFATRHCSVENDID